MNKFCVLLLLLLPSCHPKSCLLEPTLLYNPTNAEINALPSPFPPLTEEEKTTSWGRELYLGIAFARSGDFYRAIGAYQSALFLHPPEERTLQAQYAILECYYFGGKRAEAIDYFENSSLRDVSNGFPAYRELLILLYDLYRLAGDSDKACALLSLLDQQDKKAGAALRVFLHLSAGDIQALSTVPHPAIPPFLESYCGCQKSVRRAQALNGLLPGLGYLYVGQCQSAITSFLINSLFLAASYQFANHHNVPAALIMMSFEVGWYVGGINGAGLAAKAYNESLFNYSASRLAREQRFFPFLLFQTSF